MGRILENTKYKIILGVFSMLFASVMAFIWGTTRTFYAMIAIINSWGNDRKTLIAIIEVIDSILIAVALLIFAVSLYQLFIGKLNLPTWMPANNLHELKGKLGV